MGNSVRRYGLLIICCVLVMVGMQTEAEAFHKGPDDFHNDYPVLKGPSVSAEKVRDTLLKEHGVNLVNTTVEGDLTIHPEATRHIEARNVVFAGDVYAGFSFTDLKDITAIPEEELVESEERSYHFTDTTFMGPASFNTEVGQLEFHNCQFERVADFQSLQSEYVDMNETTFKGDALFSAMDVTAINVPYVEFQGAVDFTGARFGEEWLGSDEATNAVYGPFNAPGLESEEPIRIHWAQFGDRMIGENIEWAQAGGYEEGVQGRMLLVNSNLLFWKGNFEELGYDESLRQVEHRLVQVNRDYFMKRFTWNWWKAWLFDLFNGHGARPFRPLWYGAVTILIFSLIYYRADPFVEKDDEQDTTDRPKRPLWLFSLLYSTDTFVPFTTITGVKDWGWVMSPGFRWVELSERLLGVILSSLELPSIGTEVA